jgi:hypothetical protein
VFCCLLVATRTGQNVFRSSNGREYLLEEEQRGDDEVRAGCCEHRPPPPPIFTPLSVCLPVCCLVAGACGVRRACLTNTQVVQKAADIQEAISEGANSFLFTEYKYMGVFMVGGVGLDVSRARLVSTNQPTNQPRSQPIHSTPSTSPVGHHGGPHLCAARLRQPRRDAHAVGRDEERPL